MRIKEPYRLKHRKDRDTWEFSIQEPSGLPREVCDKWHNRSFSAIPVSVRQQFRSIQTDRDARLLVVGFIEYLRRATVNPATSRAVMFGTWADLFRSDDSPRAERLRAKGRLYSPQTLRSYGSIINLYLKDSPLWSMRIDKISGEDITAFLSSVVKKFGPSRTAESVFSLVRMMFREYRLRSPGFYDPFETIERPRYQPEKRETLSEKEVILLFSGDHFREKIGRLAFLLAFFCGLRRSEILALRWDSVTGNVITIREAWKNADSKNRVIGLPKWGKFRKVPAAAIVLEELSRVPRIEDRIFVYPDGSPRLGTWWANTLKAALRKAGISRKIVPHSARHTLASILYEKGTPIKYVQDLLGHSDLKVTDIYIHPPSDTLEKIGDKINGIGKQRNRKGRNPAGRAAGSQS